MTLEEAKLKYPKGSIANAGSFGKVLIRDWKQAPGDKEPWATVFVGLVEGSLPASMFS